MENLISSFIIQAKDCKLPGIGRFRVTVTPAQSNMTSKTITPPVTEVQFRPREEKLTDGLVKYISSKKAVTTSQALAEIKDWCAQAASKLNHNEEIVFPALGVLKQGGSGNLFFKPETGLPFFEPLHAERAFHKDQEHALLVGDNETTFTAMSQPFSPENAAPAETKNNWKTLALVLITLALVWLFFYFYQHTFSLNSTGNQVRPVPDTPAATYTNQ